MTVWRPPQFITVKVLGLAWRRDELLLAEVQDDEGRVKGVRALGGRIEFGETREEALQREFQEELGCDVTLLGPWHSFENLFVHEGATGHEYVFAANIHLADERLYLADTVTFLESDLSGCRASWFAPTALPDGVELYPSGLLPLIRNGTVSAPG